MQLTDIPQMNPYRGLIDAVLAAIGPSRELDARIHATVNQHRPVDWTGGLQIISGDYRYDCGDSWSIWYESPRFTGSIDAAMTSIPKGWEMSNLCWSWVDKSVTAYMVLPGDDVPANTVSETAATPALAIIATAQRARDAS